MKSFFLVLGTFLLSTSIANAQPTTKYTKQDTMMGSNTPQRSWWDVQRYDIDVTPDYATKTIRGRVTITYTITAEQHNDYLQVDLQKPMEIDSLYYNGNMYINYPAKPFYSDGNHWFVPLP
ncbi:MAG TPA: M1 family peptidase, partial [Flavisolibacter sp.]